MNDGRNSLRNDVLY
jgi:hypothetical protein